ncbi:MAG: hypothetical protein NC938_06145 [Candidatus Omnitrophica bacterium]|nr:hypothetical protein [Candidatus Omnitrophota bacterium]
MICLCAAICGCATMRYPCAYKVEGVEFREFKDLDDDKALKLVALIYNVRTDCWEDGIARSVTLDEYIGLLRKRNSPYVRNSGIFDIKYEKVKLSTWKDNDLVKLYESLEPKAAQYYLDCAPELTESQNARRIVYLTGISCVVKELKKRDISQKAVMVAAQVLSAALTIALAMI